MDNIWRIAARQERRYRIRNTTMPARDALHGDREPEQCAVRPSMSAVPHCVSSSQAALRPAALFDAPRPRSQTDPVLEQTSGGFRSI
jgi:hypothetical protein